MCEGCLIQSRGTLLMVRGLTCSEVASPGLVVLGGSSEEPGVNLGDVATKLPLGYAFVSL